MPMAEDETPGQIRRFGLIAKNHQPAREGMGQQRFPQQSSLSWPIRMPMQKPLNVAQSAVTIPTSIRGKDAFDWNKK